MKSKIVAERYAQAYVSFATSRITIEKVVEEMKLLRRLLRENPELEEILKAPEVPFSEKTRLIEQVLVEGFSLELKDFLKYLVEKLRFEILVDVCDYIRLKYAHGNVVNVVLSSTFPLELEIVQVIKDKIEARLLKKVNLYMELNPDLLGGIQIKIGNQVLDGSVRHKLQELKHQLLTV